MQDFKTFIDAAAKGRTFDQQQAAAAFEIMMTGGASDAQIAGFLMALRVRGETVDEITGAARVMRAKAASVAAPPEAIDIVGTGGDAKGTFNISTGTAIVVAGAGVPVAKHGNRSISSKSGSADVLEALGVNLNATPERVSRAINEAGLGFMFAPAHHSAMKHVMPARQALATRTLFNLLGPLTNPAGVKRKLVGVFAHHWVRPIAEVLHNLGIERALVVHGADGMDEITTTGVSFIAELKDGKINEYTLTPEQAGLSEASAEELIGGDAQHNAAMITKLLDGAAGPFRDIVLLNAAAALMVAEKAEDLREGVRLAAQAIDTGAAKERLAKLVAITNS